MRRLNFMFYAIFSLGFYTWFFHFVPHSGVSLVNFIAHLCDTDCAISPITDWTSFVKNFEIDALAELYKTPEEAKQAAYEVFCENGNQVGSPTLLNISYGAKLICLDKDVIGAALIASLENFIKRQENPSVYETAETLITLCHQERVNLKDRKTPPSLVCGFDLTSWKKDKFSSRKVLLH